MSKELWYEKEAGIWNEALPLGNGRLGAMVFSGAVSDRLQINEDTLWSGYPNMVTKKHSIEELAPIRKLVDEKKYVEATEKTSEIMLGVHSQAYVPYGSIYVDIFSEKNDVTNYRRSLDLNSAIVKTTYMLGDISIQKEVFTSLSDDVLVYHIKSSEPVDIRVSQAVELENQSFSRDKKSIIKGKCPTYISPYTKTVEYDQTKESINFCSILKFLNDEKTYFGGNSAHANADKITFVFSLKTSFNGFDKMPESEGRDYVGECDATLNDSLAFSYDELKARHIKEYKKYFDRVSLEIDGESFDDVPTYKRIKNVAEGVIDNGLTTLLFDYGRYLTISSSMEGTETSNLQGIWNDKLMPPWSSNYTMNINTQMNYWPTEAINLSECHLPFLLMLKDFAKKGNNFGLRGWSSWHNSDIWRFNHEATKGVFWGFWQMGGFWSLRHIWEHYAYTRNKEFLEEYLPVYVGAAEFLEDWMIQDENGYYTTCPSTSPENRFMCGDTPAAVSKGSSMDMSIIYDVFDKLIKILNILNKDSSHFEEIKSKLQLPKIGKDGRILEWGEELPEMELGHRHISHLYGFFPGDVLESKEYVEAVRKSVECRIKNGGGHTGWSNAWIANVYARLGDGENVSKYINNMFKKSIYPNMFDAHPPFQIDGNFGICSAICEALVQSHTDDVKYIPAIPPEWKSGRVSGLAIRGGKTVSFSWSDGKADFLKNILY